MLDFITSLYREILECLGRLDLDVAGNGRLQRNPILKIRYLLKPLLFLPSPKPDWSVFSLASMLKFASGFPLIKACVCVRERGESKQRFCVASSCISSEL